MSNQNEIRFWQPCEFCRLGVLPAGGPGGGAAASMHLLDGQQQGQRQRVRGFLGVRDQRMKVLYNAVDPPNRNVQADRAEVRRELGLGPEQKLVLMVGRLTEAKDHPTLFCAAQRVLAIDPPVTFLCAGHGELEAALRRELAERKLTDRVRLLGLRRDVPRLLSAADVFCLTSRFEGFPNAVAEAMAAGLPVVCTRFEGVEEVVQDGRTGLLVGVGDDEALARRVGELLAEPCARERWGKRPGNGSARTCCGIACWVRWTSCIARSWRPDDVKILLINPGPPHTLPQLEFMADAGVEAHCLNIRPGFKVERPASSITTGMAAAKYPPRTWRN